MQRAIILLTTSAAMLIGLSGCESSNQDARRNAELEAELERLENDLGRLEFRVYQLENPDAEATVSAPTISEP
jgi:hypothetical protein